MDKKTIKRINELVRDISRGHAFEGIGKPEPLKGNKAGCWSRRIDDKNRFVYRMEGENGDVCVVLQCAAHYDD
jgi:toxin YoeB